MVRSQLSSLAIVAACFTTGRSGVGWFSVSVTGSDAIDDMDTGGSGAGVTGAAVFALSGLGSVTSRFLSRLAAGGLSCAPVMLRLTEAASSSNGLAFRMAVQDNNAKSAFPSA